MLPFHLKFCYIYVTDRSLTGKTAGHYGMTRNEIIEAAFKAWGRGFYLETSLTQVAKELKVTKPALYRHFRNKQALLDAMYGYFFDDYAAFTGAAYKQAGGCGDPREAIFILVRINVEYYARNVYAALFFLINVYCERKDDAQLMPEQLRARGLDINFIQRHYQKDLQTYPWLIQLASATFAFSVAHFHKVQETLKHPPSGEAIRQIIPAIEKLIAGGLCLNRERIEKIDFEELEGRISGDLHHIEEDPLLTAVAEVVAEAGPWQASMDMVARRSGLSKSSLYAHFKNKKDMLYRLFITEFQRIAAFAKAGMKKSPVQEERLYLGIFSIADYLRSRPQILVAMDWIRTRRLDLGDREKLKGLDRFTLFDNIDALEKNTPQDLCFDAKIFSHWTFFLIINTIMQRQGNMNFGDVPNDAFRTLYRFIVSGVKGFNLC
jgi:AcrR family transcriptional regulator